MKIEKKLFVSLLIVLSVVLAGCHNDPAVVSGWPTGPVTLGAQIIFNYEIPEETSENAHMVGGFDDSSAGSIDCTNIAGTSNPVEGQCTMVVNKAGVQGVVLETIVKDGHGGTTAETVEGAEGTGAITNPGLLLLESTTTTIDRVDPVDSVVVGEMVTFYVSVTPSGNRIPSGRVTVSGAGGSCIASLDLRSWTGSCSYELTTVGAVTIMADYEGNEYNESSSTSIDYIVDPGTVTNPNLQLLESTTTTIDRVISPNLSLQGQSATFYVSVSGSNGGTPTGSVAVTGAGGSCTATLDASGEGNCSYQMNQAGQFTITAAYSGDSVYGVSNGTTSYGVLAPTPVPTSDSCNNDDDCDGFANDVDECPDVYSLNNDGCP